MPPAPSEKLVNVGVALMEMERRSPTRPREPAPRPTRASAGRSSTSRRRLARPEPAACGPCRPARSTGAPRSMSSFTVSCHASTPPREAPCCPSRCRNIRRLRTSAATSHAEVEQLPHAVGVRRPRELREQLASLAPAPHEPAEARVRRSRGRVAASFLAQAAISRSTPSSVDRNAAPLEQREHVAPPSPRGHRDGRRAASHRASGRRRGPAAAR